MKKILIPAYALVLIGAAAMQSCEKEHNPSNGPLYNDAGDSIYVDTFCWNPNDSTHWENPSDSTDWNGGNPSDSTDWNGGNGGDNPADSTGG